jgi:hypothetical protein
MHFSGLPYGVSGLALVFLEDYKFSLLADITVFIWWGRGRLAKIRSGASKGWETLH